MDAKEFIKKKDRELGEVWSNDSEELANALEEYALAKVIEYIKDDEN